MKKIERTYFRNTYQQIDIAIMSICGIIILGLSQGTAVFFHYFNNILQIKIQTADLLGFGVLIAVWHYIFVLFGFYRIRSLSLIRSDIAEIIKAMTLCAVLFYLSISLKEWPDSIIIASLFWITSSSIFIVKQILFRQFIRYLRLKNRNIRYVLIVGTNRRSYEYLNLIQDHPELGYKCIGLCDDELHYDIGMQSQLPDLVCNLNNVKEFIRHNVVDEVVITLPISSFYNQIDQINQVCEEQGVKIRLSFNLFSFNSYQPSHEGIGTHATILHHSDRIIGPMAILKRLLDFSGSLIGIIFLSPLLFVVAAIIRVTSPGPAIFKQKRLGRNKRIFTMYKFRTMVQDAEILQKDLETKNEATGAVFKIKNDPRITPIGKFLRKTSIDELPQLFNVLKGDMSLIGPRPLPLRDYSKFENDEFRRRMSVMPGITCIWQANGRSNVSFNEWMMMDLEYVDTWSMKKDISILVQTFLSVLKGTGAA